MVERKNPLAQAAWHAQTDTPNKSIEAQILASKGSVCKTLAVKLEVPSFDPWDIHSGRREIAPLN